MTIIDTMRAVEQLQMAGMPHEQAKAAVAVVRDSVIDSATKADLAMATERLDAKIDHVAERLDAKIDQVAERLDAKIDHVAERLDAKIDQVAERLDAKIDHVAERLESKVGILDAKIDNTMYKLFAGTIAINIGLAGLALAISHYVH